MILCVNYGHSECLEAVIDYYGDKFPSELVILFILFLFLSPNFFFSFFFFSSFLLTPPPSS